MELHTLEKITKKTILLLIRLLPLKIRIFIFFYLRHGYLMSWKDPNTYSELIQIRKLSLGVTHALYADKYKVRNYVTETIGDQYLIPLVGAYDRLTLEILNRFEGENVIKTNHGSGLKHLEFIPSKLTNEEIVEKFNKALMDDYVGGLMGETQYSHIERKIIVERKLASENKAPDDFKFHVFRNGGDIRWFLQVDFGRFEDQCRNMYDSDLNLISGFVALPSGDYKLPAHEYLVEMISVAKKLAEPFDYSRVDLYLSGRRIYFGEITLTPGSGFRRLTEKAMEVEWGRLWLGRK